MAIAPTDQRMAVLAASFFAAALTIVAVRTARSGRVIESRPIPATDLQGLTPFLSPLPNVSFLAPAVANGIVVPRDPFAPMGIVRDPVPPQPTVRAPVPTTTGGQKWVVSTILVEGSRKSAIVNNAWVTVGDSLGGGYRLTAVERDHIVVTDAKGIRHIVSIQDGES